MTRPRALSGAVPTALLALVVLGLLSACGSDQDEQAVAALKSQILANNAMTGSSEISSTQASCIANGAVDEITVERLQEYRILDDDLEVDRKLNEVPLSEKDADLLAGVFLECSDAETIFEDRLLEQLAPQPGARRDALEDCVRETVSPESVRAILAQSFAKTDAQAYADLAAELQECRTSAE